MGESVILKPGATSLATLEELYRDSPGAVLDPACRPKVERAAAVIGEAAAGEAAVYGVNTGFGKLASERIPAADTAALQRNLILSHCCGVGALAERQIVRFTMTLKLLSLGRGASQVSSIAEQAWRSSVVRTPGFWSRSTHSWSWSSATSICTRS